MNNIPWYGWALLALLVVLLVAINFSLITALRNRKNTPGAGKGTSPIQRMSESLRQPWKVEDDMLAELSKRAGELRGSGDKEHDSGKTSK